jgi:hypothetical protein
MTQDRMGHVMRGVSELEAEMRSSGAWVFGGRLHGPDSATVVRVSDGEALTTDGPFAESKEHLGGFYIIDVEELDAALRWATRTSELVGAPIEVRPLADYPQP